MRRLKIILYFTLAVLYDLLCELCWSIGDRITLVGDWADNRRARLTLLRKGLVAPRPNMRKGSYRC